jgi:hypothetical protein
MEVLSPEKKGKIGPALERDKRGRFFWEQYFQNALARDKLDKRGRFFRKQYFQNALYSRHGDGVSTSKINMFYG